MSVSAAGVCLSTETGLEDFTRNPNGSEHTRRRVGGIRNAFIQVPIGTYTGWNLFNKGIACFGVYSMVDGHRMTTLHADIYHVGLFRAMLGQDIQLADGAQLMGPMMFTPDSRNLVATSEHVWEWDLSGLR